MFGLESLNRKGVWIWGGMLVIGNFVLLRVGNAVANTRAKSPVKLRLRV